MHPRSIIVGIVFALLLAFPLTAAAIPPAPARVAYVDVQRILTEVEDAKAARARLQKWLDGKQKEINAEQEALRKEKELLDKQASAMKDEVRAQKANELQKKVIELAQKWERARAEAADKERKEMEPIVAKIDQLVATIARRDGITMVLDKRDAGMRYTDSAYDLTNEVITSYNAAKK